MESRGGSVEVLECTLEAGHNMNRQISKVVPQVIGKCMALRWICPFVRRKSALAVRISYIGVALRGMYSNSHNDIAGSYTTSVTYGTLTWG